ncbi:MAG: 4-alpha-glucanotransferase, partial [Hyphomicrobiales bacterium]|nr:4-alpha-glucanotransferase [Hyphomicrobiales bacterium]
MPDASLLHELAREAGLARSYVRHDGEAVRASEDALRAILQGLDLPAQTDGAARDSLAALQERRSAALAPVMIAVAQRMIAVPLGGGVTAAHVQWRLVGEDGASLEGRANVLHANGSASFHLPPQQAGYYRLEACGTNATLIAAPERCWVPPAFAAGARGWGVATQVYGLSSSDDFGVGGFAQASALAQSAGALGASFVGLSPLHALFAQDREKHSPYSPSNRLLLEPMFIDPRKAAGFANSAAPQLLSSAPFAQRVASARSPGLIDYPGAWDVQRELLQAAWEHVRQGPADPAFAAFRASGGQALERHALFEALSERFAAQGLSWVGAWPAAYRDAEATALQEARGALEERVAFHMWLQWNADLQLADAAHAARGAGMEVGLYRDLAVGADRAGSEIWSDPAPYATSLSIGAPPDPLGPEGQNWGLPPLHPLRLEATGLLRFRHLIAANMRHAGALRIDHAFQLARLFVIPEGGQASDGAYVSFPFEAMLACLRVESHRAQCLVIGEDLGTAPEGFSDALMRSGILSYRLLFFERAQDGAFVAPERYPRDALAAVSTHDLPTLAGWWRGLDIDLRSCFGLADAGASEEDRRARAIDKSKLRDALERNELPASDDHQAPYLPVFRYLARSTSMLLALQAEDLAGDVHQANVPGPSLGHPNWRRRLPMDVATLCAPDGLLARSAVAMAEEGRALRGPTGGLASPPPRATYRLQLSKTFTLNDAAGLAPYLSRLGVSHVYASPIQAARPGSTHGYDIVDHARINDELGGESGFRRFTEALRDNGLKLLLDIVPNHMGVGGADNRWWLSTLEWGEASPHAHVFDIDWERPGANGKLVLPFLGKPYGQALREGELNLRFDAQEGSFSVWHWEHRFPINPLDYRYLLEWAQVAGGAGAQMRPLLAISEELRDFVDAPRPSTREGRVERCERLKEALARAAHRSSRIGEAITKAVAYANGHVGVHDSFGALQRLLDRQAYRLAYWRVASAEVNYRRFFDINALAGIRVEEDDVFEATHALIFRLVAQGAVHGLRIDHVDGLADPAGYLGRLQARTGPGFYIAVEKILEPGEALRNWPVAGTTGYDVLTELDRVFVCAPNEPAFDAAYEETTGAPAHDEDALRRTQLELLNESFGSELESLVADVKRAADANTLTSDITAAAIRRALAEIVAALPVYRTYLGDGEPGPEDRNLVEDAVAQATTSTTLEDAAPHDLVGSLLLAPLDAERSPATQRLLARIRRRFQQLTGPVMAKSLEDTLFYRNGRFIALNEVGGDPSRFALDVRAFHDMAKERAALWPASLSATA